MLTKKSKPGFGILPLKPKKLISLWDMIEFLAIDFLILCENLKTEKSIIPKLIALPNMTKEFREEVIKTCIDVVSHFEKISEDFELIETKGRCERFKRSLQFSITGNPAVLGSQPKELAAPEIVSEIEGIEEAIEKELKKRKFVFIPPAKVEFFEQEKLFGDVVFNAFQDAREEIKAAGNCLSADLNTAAVFHLMRVMELGLRALAGRLKAKALIKKLKQTKIPIELGTWDEIISTLETKLEGLRMMPRGPKREHKIETFNELLKEFRSVKDLWRNKVMHTRATYDSEQAQSAFKHVRNFMQKLATSDKF